MTSGQTAVVRADPRAARVRDLLEKSKPQIALALPKHMTPERMLRVAMTAIQQNADLLECEPLSVIGSIVQASQLGLEFVLGQAYLVPFNVRVKTRDGERKVKLCQLIPGYRGLAAIAKRSGVVTNLEAHVVYARDAFEFEYGTAAKLIHKPVIAGAKDRGAIVAAYAIAFLRNAQPQFEVMPREDLDRVRASSKAKDSPAYRDWLDEMFRKAPAKRLCKWLPASVELATAARIDDRALGGELPDYEDLALPGSEEFQEMLASAERAEDSPPTAPQTLEDVARAAHAQATVPAESTEQAPPVEATPTPTCAHPGIAEAVRKGAQPVDQPPPACAECGHVCTESELRSIKKGGAK